MGFIKHSRGTNTVKEVGVFKEVKEADEKGQEKKKIITVPVKEIKADDRGCGDPF